MQRTLREHILSLEQKTDALSSQLMQESDALRRNQLEAELRAVQSALTHYRAAFEIESSLSMNSIPGSKKYSTGEMT